MRHFFLILSFLLIFGLAFGTELHRCVDEAGKITYQDSPCQKTAISVSVLSLQSDNASPKVVKEQIQQLKKAGKKQQTLENKQVRLQNQAAKRLMREEEKAARRDLRCQRLDEKYAFLESQLRAGAKFKRRQTLETELEHVRLMQRRYCSRE